METVSIWDTLGERLRWAIDQQQPEGKSRGVGLLISRLKEHGALGANYPSINSYLSDKVEPPLAFVREAANALGVRVEWLAFGVGKPTEAEEAARRADLDTFRELLGKAVPEIKQLDGAVEAALTDLTLRSFRLMVESGAANVEQVEESGLGAVLAATAAAWWALALMPVTGVGEGARPIRADPRQFSSYALAALHAFSLALDIAARPPDLLSEQDIALQPPWWLMKQDIERRTATEEEEEADDGEA